MSNNFINIYKRYFTILNQNFKNYYEVLGVTPRATQADIKSAYYRLSKMHHPDRNKSSKDAVKMFQDITAAYEVLGNYKSRRLYDKGMLFDETTKAPKKEDFIKTRSDLQRRGTAPNQGRTPIYDFDAWARLHYGESFSRRNSAKNDFYKEAESNKHSFTEHIIFFFIVVTSLTIIMTFTFSNSLDRPLKPKVEKTKDDV